MLSWGCSSVGRAPEWHSGGRQFDSVQLHHDLLSATAYFQKRLRFLFLGQFPAVAHFSSNSNAPATRSTVSDKPCSRARPYTWCAPPNFGPAGLRKSAGMVRIRCVSRSGRAILRSCTVGRRLRLGTGMRDRWGVRARVPDLVVLRLAGAVPPRRVFRARFRCGRTTRRCSDSATIFL